MKICIYGAGAIGGLLGAQLSLAGEEVTMEPARAPKGQIIDLMEALKASLSARKAEAGEATAAKRRPARAKGRATAPKKKAAKGE